MNYDSSSLTLQEFKELVKATRHTPVATAADEAGAKSAQTATDNDINLMFQLFSKKLAPPAPPKAASKEKQGINVNELKK
jgi:hypothetical protein